MNVLGIGDPRSCCFSERRAFMLRVTEANITRSVMASLLAAASGQQADGKASSGAASPADWADVEASLDGDGEAYARLVRRYQQRIAAYIS